MKIPLGYHWGQATLSLHSVEIRKTSNVYAYVIHVSLSCVGDVSPDYSAGHRKP